MNAEPDSATRDAESRQRGCGKVVALDPATVAILDTVGRDTLVVDEALLEWLD